MAFVREAKELVEAVAKGVILCGSSLVPFSDQAGGVACVVQGLGNRDFLWRQAESGFFIERSGRIELVAEARRGAPGEETCPGGAAVGARHVACGKAHAIVRDGVDMGRRDFRIALAAQFSVTEVVGEEDDDVGSCASGCN